MSSSSKTTSPRVSPPASEITKAETSSALATPAAAVPEQSDKTFVLPWEQSAYGLKRPDSSLTKQGRWKRARAASAREFDKFVKENGRVPISGDPQWQEKYLQAEADLTALLKNKPSTAVKKKARARVQDTRHELKWRLLKAMKAMKAAQAIRTDQ
ncbi:hypothetical protein [Pseudomonas sp. St316]|uniref:hypothetical protein n=1 Tax=Pseudomonas sp. St316 TaxID=2678257 RepID=UPI0020173496|nr:hypothetical protein [Pseudomonas sp. St316]